MFTGRLLLSSNMQSLSNGMTSSSQIPSACVPSWDYVWQSCRTTVNIIFLPTLILKEILILTEKSRKQKCLDDGWIILIICISYYSAFYFPMDRILICQQRVYLFKSLHFSCELLLTAIYASFIMIQCYSTSMYLVFICLLVIYSGLPNY